MALNIVVLGPPGAGKGTQAMRLASDRGIPAISTGEILRSAIQEDSELGRRAKASIDAGRLVSDDVMIDIVRQRIGQSDAVKGLVLDGFPRTVTQAVALDEMLNGRDPLVVLKIQVPDEELIARLGRRRVCGRCGTNADAFDAASTACARCGGAFVQRSDDAEEIVRERLRIYGRDTKPLVEFYRARPTFRSVDGNQQPEEVAAALRTAIESVLASPVVAGGADRKTGA